MEGQIRAWLKAGIFEKGIIFLGDRGTPQGSDKSTPREYSVRWMSE